MLLIVVLITVPIIRESNNKLLESVLIVLTVRVVGDISRGGGCDQVGVEVGVRVGVEVGEAPVAGFQR